MSKLKDLHKKWSQNPDYEHAHNAMAMEFELARTLIKARVDAGLTQEQVAKRMKTSQAAIARMESGKIKPSASSLERYATAIGRRLRISFEPRNST